MNDTTRLDVRPDVADFLDRVRARLDDLSDDEREELLGGLEADLTELVNDGGSVAELGDPRAYADELRTAAGLEDSRSGRAPGGVRRPRRPVRAVVGDVLAGTRGRWDAWAAGGPTRHQVWSFVTVIQPAWWVLRGWVAAQCVDLALGPWEELTVLPRLGDDVSGKVLLLAMVVGSVLMGTRRLWPASQATRSVLARTALLGLNIVAVLALLVVVDRFPSASFIHSVHHPRASGLFGAGHQSGLVLDGRQVRNVFAYDVEGKPLEGVQLFDQAGRPLAIDPNTVGWMRYEGRRAAIYPWLDGQQRVWNVYPLPVRVGDQNLWHRPRGVWESDNPPVSPEPPLVAVPPLDWEFGTPLG